MSRVLYLGLDPCRYHSSKSLFHYPIIKIRPLPFVANDFSAFTHWIFTSQTSVKILAPYFNHCRSAIAVGQATAQCIKDLGVPNPLVANDETQEGIIALLSQQQWNKPHFFWPRSAQARPILAPWILAQNWNLTESVIYDVVANVEPPIPDLNAFEEIVFTSPSTVDAFVEFFGDFPENTILTAIGPVTREHLAIKREILKNY